MTDSDLDALDRECAVAMGMEECPTQPGSWHKHPDFPALEHGRDEAGGPYFPRMPLPSPTRNPADFVALLRWCGDQGRTIDLRRWKKKPAWQATINLSEPVHPTASDPDPMVALALAVRAWAKSRKE
jgi:hypothetical protein